MAGLQARCPEAAQWPPGGGPCLVAIREKKLAGFLLWRDLGADESEILNLAVAPEFRRSGVATALLARLKSRSTGTIFLEVRESNQPARALYQAAGFKEVGRRNGYYQNPGESAIVVKFHSC